MRFCEADACFACVGMAATMLAAGAFGLAAPAHAAGTPAGTVINNSATATYDLPGRRHRHGDLQHCQPDRRRAARRQRRLDRRRRRQRPFPAAINQLLTFRVTNAGNGSEAFALTARDNGRRRRFRPVGDRDPDRQRQRRLRSGPRHRLRRRARTIRCSRRTARRCVFVLSSIPAGATNGQRGRVDLVAVAKTGSGAPGTTFAGQGEGGGNAVVGATGADAEDDGYYAVAAASVAFVKSATVADPFGGATQVPGSIITYQLVATVSGSGSLANLRIADAIPAGLDLPGRLDPARGRRAHRCRRRRCGRVHRHRHRRPARHRRRGLDPHRHFPGRDRLKELNMRLLLDSARLSAAVGRAGAEPGRADERSVRRARRPPTRTGRSASRSRRRAWSRRATGWSSCFTTATPAPRRRPTSW